MKQILTGIVLIAFCTLKVSGQPWLPSGNDIFNTNTGNIGIGTMSPYSRLHIKGFTNNSSASSLLVQNSNGAHMLQIVDNGYVGIGTTPRGLLDVQSDPAVSGNEIYFTGLSTAAYQNTNSLRLNFVGYDQTAGFGIQAINTGSYGTKDLVFYAHDGDKHPDYTSYDEVIRFKSNGKVGIGTTSPVAKLDIVGLGAYNIDFQTTGRIAIKGSSPGVSFNDGTYERSFIGWGGSGISGQAIGIYTPTNDVRGGWNTLNVMGNGSIALGAQTANENAKLDVRGNVFCDSKILIGITDITKAGTYSLAVNGDGIFNRIRIKQYPWADFVFEEKYRLLPLEEVEKFITANKHLPDVPTATEVEKDGTDIGSTQAILLQKIEELTLYAIEQNKMIIEQNKKAIEQSKIAAAQQEQINLLLKELTLLKEQQKK